MHDHTPREVFFTIAAEAPKLGLPFAGHVPSAITIDEAIDSGMRSIEHLANFRIFGDCMKGEIYRLQDCEEVFDKLARRGVWQTPTLTFFGTLPDVFTGTPMLHSDYASDSLLKLTSDNVKLSHLDAKVLDRFRLANQVALKAVPDLKARGNRFLAGCDGMVPGFCLHDELEWFTKAGFTPLEALQTATINPARYLNREASQGTVEAGKRADLILLDADPTRDIRNTSHIAAVVLRGKLLRKTDLDRIVERHLRTKN